MKGFYFIVFFLFITTTANAQHWRWVNYLQGGGGNHAVFDVHVPPGDNYSYNVGRYRVTTTFYGQDTNVVNPYHAGDRDVYISKQDSNGNFEWIVTDGGPFSDFANGVTTDEFGNVYITGTFEQTATFGGSTSIVGDVAGDVFIAKYDENGVFQWVIPWTGPGWEWGQEIECDENGFIYVGGYQTGGFNYGTGILPDKGYFLAKLDYDGNVIWCKGPTNNAASSDSWIYGLEYHEGSLYFSGAVKLSVNFDAITLVGYTWQDGMLGKMDLDGNIEWAYRFGGVYYDDCNDIAIQDSIIYAVGSYSGSAMFDTIPMLAPIVGSGGGDALDSRDAYLAKFKLDGSCLWVKDMKGDYIDDHYSVLINKKGNIVLTGSYDQIDINSSCCAYGNIKVREYDPDGNVNWTLMPTGAHLGEGMAIEEDASGNYFFGGKIKGDHYFQDILVVCPNVINHTAVWARIYPPLDLGIEDTLEYCTADTIWMYKPSFLGSPVIQNWVVNPANVLFQNNDSIQVIVDGLDSVSYVVSNTFVVDTITHYINELLLPVVNLGADFTTCNDEEILNAGSNAEYYNWNAGFVLYDSLNTITTTGQYTVIIEDANSCLSYDTINVTFFEKPIVDLGADFSTCVSSLVLNAGSNGEYYDWGSGFVVYDSLLTINTSGTYFVTVQNIDLCEASDTIQIILNSSPVVNLGPDITTCETIVTLHAGTTGEYYDWGSGNVLFDSLLVVTVSGTYSVIVEDSYGCISSDAVQVTLLDCSGLESNGIHDIMMSYNVNQNLIYILDTPDELNVQLYDISGNIIASYSGVHIGSTISLANFSDGIYILSLETHDLNSTLVQKIIVQK